MLSEKQAKYVQLEKKRDEYKVFLEELQQATKELVAEAGIGGHFQDGEGTVYQVHESEGKFVYFDKFEVKRTKRPNERAGSLSVVKAKELGYDV